MMIVETIPYLAVVFPTSTVINIYFISILIKTDNFASHSHKTFKTVTVTLWSEIPRLTGMWSEIPRLTGTCNHGIRYNIYSILKDE